MSRRIASLSIALVLCAGTAFALDGGPDASLLDAGILDGGAPDVVLLDGAADAEADAGDATADASTADASDGAAIQDAKSDVCDPNVEPCTTRADTGPENDAGDVEEPAQTGGCSCDAAPAAASTTPIAFLLAAFALMRRKRR